MDVLVVDDGSDDGTYRVASSMRARVARHPYRLGYGAALQTGFRYAVRHGYTLCVQLDADGQHDPAFIPMLSQPVREGRANVAIASRFLREPGHPKVPRMLGHRVIRWLGRVLANLEIEDPTSGYRAIDRRTLERLAREGFPDDYPDIDVLIALRAEGFRIIEIATTMRPRRGGTSMHHGLRPLFYAYKVGLAAVLAAWRGRRASDQGT